jgi:cell division inhibitor SepF
VGSLRKSGVWLGLAEDRDEELDSDVDDYPADDPAGHVGQRSRRRPAADVRTARRSPAAAGGAPAADAEGFQIATIHARGFRDARTIGEYYRQDIPVVIDLSGLDEPDARRIVDFAAGLIFGRRGSIHRLARGVFLLSPPGVGIVTGERSQLGNGDFFDQS